jgi:hypothetical protein
MSTATKNTVIGVFTSHGQAQATVNELRNLGFTESQIGLVSKRAGLPDVDQQTDAIDFTKEGAATGAALGVGAGTLWGLGILAGALPAIGPVIAGGTLAALVSSAATGAAAGSLGGALLGMGISDGDTEYYDSEFTNGRVIVTINAGDRAAIAEQVILEHGGHNRERSLT